MYPGRQANVDMSVALVTLPRRASKIVLLACIGNMSWRARHNYLPTTASDSAELAMGQCLEGREDYDTPQMDLRRKNRWADSEDYGG